MSGSEAAARLCLLLSCPLLFVLRSCNVAITACLA
jgi:hypothetical protein